MSYANGAGGGCSLAILNQPELSTGSCAVRSKAGLSDFGLLLTAGLPNDPLHLVQVTLQRPAAGGGDAVFSPRHTSRKALGADDVVCIFKLAGMHAQIAVSCF